MLKGKV